MSPPTEQKVDWNQCTCLKVYQGGQTGSAENVDGDVDSAPVVYRIDPQCPERGKLGHPKDRGQER